MALRLRGALLGAGNIALRGHLPQWTSAPAVASEVEIVAVADLSAENRAAAAAVVPAARLYESADELLARETLDFCDVCTPPFSHRPLVERAAERGLHVVCEKPIAPCLADGEAIGVAVRAAGVVFVPCHQYHHSPQWKTVARLLPRIGRVHLVEYEVLRTEANPGNPHWSPAWRTDPALAGGGILFDHGAHILYQLRSVLGEPAAVQATVRNLRHAEYGVEDSAFVVLDFGDRLAELRLTWAARRRSIRFQFVGDAGELVGDDERVVVRAATTEEVTFDDGMSRNSSHSEWYAPLFSDFVGRVRRRDASTGPLDEALYVARVISRAYESSAEGRALPLGTGAAVPVAAPGRLAAVTGAVSRVVEPTEDRPSELDVPPVATARRTPRALRAAGVGMLLACGLWILHDVHWSSLVASMAKARPTWITAAAAVYLASVYAMAGRWRALLRPVAPLVTRADAFRAMIMGFAVSIVVPARAGELARAEWLARAVRLPRATVLGTILLDQVVNAVGLFCGVAVLPFLLDLPPWLHSAIWLAVAVFGLGAGLVYAVRPRAGRPAIAGATRTARGVRAVVAGFIGRLRLGLAALRDRRALAHSLAESAAAWALELLVVALTLRALDIPAPLAASLLVLMAANLALVVPFAPPANLGTLELGATLALMEYGVPKAHALAFALVYHLLQVIPIGVGGLALAGRSLLAGAPGVPQDQRA
ncbi:MAG: lysylphosphatidylglycerol synthase domain-containing protein [Vicinamibacteria bacterium]